MNFRATFFRRNSIEAPQQGSLWVLSHISEEFLIKKRLATKLSTFPAVTREIVEAKTKKIQLRGKEKSENAAHNFLCTNSSFFFIFTTDAPPFSLHWEKAWATTPMTLHKKKRNKEKKIFFIFILNEKIEKGKGWRFESECWWKE